MDLVKDDLVGMADSPESGDEGKDGHQDEGGLVFPLISSCRDLLRLVLSGDIFKLDIGDAALLLLAGAGDISVAYASLGRGSRSHAGQTVGSPTVKSYCN
jgi:hypothetical protein